jgi:hypothetical protein
LKSLEQALAIKQHFSTGFDYAKAADAYDSGNERPAEPKKYSSRCMGSHTCDHWGLFEASSECVANVLVDRDKFIGLDAIKPGVHLFVPNLHDSACRR